MPDIGVWRVETHGYYAANEIAATVDVIRGAVGDRAMVPVQARIEPRTRVAEGKTKQFPVIVLALRGVTAGQVLSGTADPSGEIASQRGAAVSGRPAAAAISAGPSGPPEKVNGSPAPESRGSKWDNIREHDAAQKAETAQAYAAAAARQTTAETLRACWAEAKAEGLLDVEVTLNGNTGPLGGLFAHLGKSLSAVAEPPTPSGPAAPADTPSAPPAPAAGTTSPAGTPSPALERAWTAAMAAAGQLGWTTSQLEADFASCHGGARPVDVHLDEVRAYVRDVEGRADRATGSSHEPDDDGVEVIDAELVPAGAPTLDEPPF